jgi:hypothetical protein
MNQTLTSDQVELVYTYALPRSVVPDNLYVGFFLEITLGIKSVYAYDKVDTPYVLTTETNIIPEYFPAADCDGIECIGTFV